MPALEDIAFYQTQKVYSAGFVWDSILKELKITEGEMYTLFSSVNSSCSDGKPFLQEPNDFRKDIIIRKYEPILYEINLFCDNYIISLPTLNFWTTKN